MRVIFDVLGAAFALLIIGALVILLFLGRGEPVKTSEVEKKPTFNETLTNVSRKYGVSPTVMTAIVEQESNGNMDAVRFEPGQVSRARRVAKAAGLEGRTDYEDQVRNLASSHCAAQIMGYHATRFGLTWPELHDPEVCAELSTAIYRDCYDRHAGESSKFERHRLALTCYNGSDKYARQVLARIGKDLAEEYL